jgi:hypothetical protein
MEMGFSGGLKFYHQPGKDFEISEIRIDVVGKETLTFANLRTLPVIVVMC